MPREEPEIVQPTHNELSDNDNVTGLSWLAENVHVKAEIERLRAQQQQNQQEQQQQTQVVTSIKEEVSWYTHQYEKDGRGDGSDATNDNAAEAIDLCEDSDDDVIIDEPVKKRQRIETEPVTETTTETMTTETANVQHLSRGQQLSMDMLNASSASPNGRIELSAHDIEQSRMTVDNMLDGIITEITKWDCKWIVDHESDPLKYRLARCQPKLRFENILSYQW